MLSLVVIRSHDMNRLARFYEVSGCRFVKHRHGKEVEHLSSTNGEAVFESSLWAIFFVVEGQRQEKENAGAIRAQGPAAWFL